MSEWHPESFRNHPNAQEVIYPSLDELARVRARLSRLPPLVNSWEIEHLKERLAEAQTGARFVLQGGDCAETIEECQPDILASKLKILLKMSLVLMLGGRKPVIRIGRVAGQYAKPRSQPEETRVMDDGREVTLPNYFGDLVNRAEFSEEARRANPQLLLEGYTHAAMALNFIRSLTDGGFADLHHPERWDLSFFHLESLAPELRAEYLQMAERLSEGLRFMEALGERKVSELSRAEFFTSHEGLNLEYESAQTRRVPWREGYFCLTTHLPWIGERTRQLGGAHLEFFRGIENPVGIKLGPRSEPDDVRRLIETLNPKDEAGKLVLITRMGVERVSEALPRLVEAIAREGRRVLWVSDPMHGNTHSTSSGRKTRRWSDILREVELSMDVHDSLGTVFGGVHFEMTGEDVTECVGGASALTEDDLEARYATACDPRLNYAQALEMAFRIARRLRSR